MSIESLTYAELGDRLGASPEAARSLARRLRLTRRPGNDGKVRVTVDLAEIQYKPLPARSPGGHRSEIDSLNARIEQLQAELARLEVEKRCLEACAAGHRADFEHERKRLDTLMTETRTLANFAMSAREKAARLEGELSAAWTRRRWWRWLRRSTRGTAEPKQPGARRHTRTNLIPGRPCKRKLSFSFSRQTNTRYDLWNKAGKALPGVPLSRCRISAPQRKSPSHCRFGWG